MKERITGQGFTYINIITDVTSKKPTRDTILNEFKKTYRAEPGSIEALAYDAGQIVSSVVLTKADIQNRDDFLGELQKIKDFPGVAGAISFEDGHFTKRLVYLTVHNGKIEEIAF
jgi:branched-chain amino acid transport system substrate-binding protein